VSWLQEPAAPAPPEPGHVNVEWLMQMLQSKETPTLADQYLMTKAPRAQLDKWGDPLPLSPPDQDRLDRVFAVIASPYDRTRALLRAGMLAPDEVDAVVASFPEIYGELEREAIKDMVTTAPPYQVWAEIALGVLFQKPAADVANPQAAAPPGGKGDGKPGKAAAAMASGMATQADRRDVEVREQKNS
jgi:hypothetical protein